MGLHESVFGHEPETRRDRGADMAMLYGEIALSAITRPVSAIREHGRDALNKAKRRFRYTMGASLPSTHTEQTNLNSREIE